MTVDKEIFGPVGDEEKEVFAIQALIVSIQIALHRAMTKHGVGNKELADRLGISPGRVSQIFSGKGPNLTLKTIAKIQVALDEDFEFVLRKDLQALKAKSKEFTYADIARARPQLVWQEQNVSNANRRVQAAAA